MSAMKRALVVAVAVLALAGCKSGSTAAPAGDKPSSAAASTTATTAAKPTPAKPKMTKGQSEALGSAQDYLSTQAFSYKGLINQLVQGEQFSKADATFAAKHVGANWNTQAAASAKEYLATQHFSRAGLINQLVQGEGFTKAQATYGATKAGL